MIHEVLILTKVGFITVLCTSLLCSCVRQEEGIILVQALKRHPHRRGTIESLVKERVTSLKRQGKRTTETWTYQKMDNHTYTIRAEIGLQGANRLLESFQWNMSRKSVPDYIKTKPWVVSKSSASAQKLME